MVDVMPGRDGPENLRFLKKSQLKVDIGPCRQTVEFSDIEAQRIEFSTVAAAAVKIFRSPPTEILNITRCTARWGSLA